MEDSTGIPEYFITLKTPKRRQDHIEISYMIIQVLDDDSNYITSLEKFIGLVKNFRQAHTTKGGLTTICRGHSDFTYRLLPGIGRLYGKEFTDKSALLRDELRSYNYFATRTYNDLRERSHLIILAVAQHHGMITRLLDWTGSPLAALYFAVEKNYDTDGAFIFCQTDKGILSFNQYSEQVNPLSPFKSMEDVFMILPSLSPRIKAQQGCFQLFADPTVEFHESHALFKCRIPKEYKKEIKRELFQMGVSYETLFPDYGGLCKTINYHLFER